MTATTRAGRCRSSAARSSRCWCSYGARPASGTSRTCSSASERTEAGLPAGRHVARSRVYLLLSTSKVVMAQPDFRGLTADHRELVLGVADALLDLPAVCLG